MSKKDSEKTSYRDVRQKHYTQVVNSMVNDKELTLEGKGLMTIFLSNKADWELNMKEIITRSKNGRDAHYRVVSELIEKGYFARIQFVIKGSKKFDRMEYIFSDVKEDIVQEIERMNKVVAEEGIYELVIEYETVKEKKKKQKNEEKESFPGNQETGMVNHMEPITESQDTDIRETENRDSETKYINNIKDNNTNLNNTNINNPNLNPIKVDIYDVLWDLQIPKTLKNRIKVKIDNKLINISADQLLLIEESYNYQKQQGNVIPDCDNDFSGALNDFQFSNSVDAMLDSVKEIENMRGSIQHWVLLGISKLVEIEADKDQEFEGDYSNKSDFMKRFEDEDMPY